MKRRINEQLYDVIASSIRSERVEEGVLLLEGRLAEIFSVSRSPVRQALLKLYEDGLITTFDGRGYLVGSNPGKIIKTKLERTIFTSPGEKYPARTESWKRVYNEIERDLLQHSIFGAHRISELELSKFYLISRTVSKQVLTRLELIGLIEKGSNARWLLLEWNAKRLADFYEIRRRLEPYALVRAKELIKQEDVEVYVRRLRRALTLYPDVTSAEIDYLEGDMHVRTLNCCPNKEIISILRRTHSLLLSSKHILINKSYFPEEEPFFKEHLEIFQYVQEGDFQQAAESMEKHLLASERKVVNRLDKFKEKCSIVDVPYLERI